MYTMPALPAGPVRNLKVDTLSKLKVHSARPHAHRACLPCLQGLFNFKPSVRPVPLEVHIQGYPGKFYCPRMATMNKPAYAAIQTHSPTKPVSGLM